MSLNIDYEHSFGDGMTYVKMSVSERSIRQKIFSKSDSYLSTGHHPQNPKRATESATEQQEDDTPSRLLFKCIVVIACLLSNLLAMGLGFSLSVLYAQLIRIFDADRSLVALIQSFYQAFIAVGGVLWSYPVSKLGYGYCIMIGGFVGSVCVAASSAASSVPTIIVLVGILSGAAFGIVYMGPFVVAGDIFDGYKSAVIGFVSIGSSLGQFTMSAVIEACTEYYGWGGALLIMGGLCLNAVPCGLLMAISLKHSSKKKSQMPSASAKQSLFKTELLKQKLFWLLMLNSLILAFTSLAESRFIVDLAELKGFTRREGSFFVTMIGVSNLVGGLTGAFSKVFCKISSTTHMCYWILIISISHGLVIYLDSYTGIIIAALINGLCLGNLYAHVAVTLYEIYGTEDYAPSFASWNVLKGVGNFMGGYFGGLIQDKTGSYDLLFQISIVLSVFYSLSFGGIALYKRCRRQNVYISK